MVDGDFGSCTKSALQNFQRAHNLTADGVAGPLTMNVMQRGQPGEPHSAESICTDVNAPAYHICYYEHPSHPTNNWAAVYDLGPSGSHAGTYFWHHTKECWTAAKAFETGACAQYNQEGGRVQAAGTEVVARPSRTD